MASKRKSKKSISKIPPKTAERIVAFSLRHPELGARRLVPLLKKKRISLSAAAVQNILRRRGLQSREKRLSRLNARSKNKKTPKPKSPPKKPSAKITDAVVERIVEISLQNPDFGARRLLPLLKKERIRIPASTVYAVLKRCGLQTREKRLAKTAETLTQPVLFPKTFPEKIPLEVADRIADLSLQNPDLGARRLIPLLHQEGIEVSASAVYNIQRRHGLETRNKRILKYEAQQAQVIPAVPLAEAAEPTPVPTAGEVSVPVVEPMGALEIPPGAEAQHPAEAPEPGAEPAAETAPVKKVPLKPVKEGAHWAFYAIYFFLFALIAYLGFHAVQAIQYARLETGTMTDAGSATATTTAKTEGAASEQSFEGYRRIWERNLFNIAKAGDLKPPEKISLEKIAIAKKDLGLELVGTVVADDPQWSRAIIDNRITREQETYREGDKAGEVRIKKILRNNVVITTAEGDELLTVEIKETATGSASYTGAQNVGSRPVSAPQASGGGQAPVRRLSLNLKRDEVEAAISDMDGFMKQLTITPYKSGDQPSGFMIGSITPQNVLRKMGLRSRDVVTAINDEAITGPEQAADFFERLSRGGEITINFQRRRRDRQIRLNIQ